MRRGAKRAKPTAKVRGTASRQSIKSEDSRARDREKRLAEALKREEEARTREVAALKREGEALEQQTATSEILKVIADTRTDITPVFEAILRSAVRLFNASGGAIRLFDGELVHLGAVTSPNPEADDRLRRMFPHPPDREWASERPILDGTVVHIPDTEDEPSELTRRLTPHFGFRRLLGVPMLSEGQIVGAITVAGSEPGPYSARQIALLQTFADQAVIAIENVRLFKELEARNSDLTEALERQTATSQILRVISNSPTDIRPVLEAVAGSATRLCEAYDAMIALKEGDRLRVGAHHGPIPIPWRATPRPLNRDWVSGRAVVDRQIVHIHDLAASGAEFPLGQADAVKAGHRTTLGVPLLREHEAIGVILIRRLEVRPFTDKQIALLQTFADQAVIAIENVRLFKELEKRNAAMTETLEQQTATAEILRVISSSPTDVQPVFDAIVASAQALSGAAGTSAVFLVRDDVVTVAAADGVSPAWRAQYPRAITPDTVVGRAIIEGRTVHAEDLRTDPAYQTAPGRLIDVRTILGVPMLKDGEPLGVIAVWRWEVMPFSAQQVALLETFADQALIAIENVRLFKELEARTHALTRSIGELRALGEVGQAISSTLDLQTVLGTIVTRATQLSGTDAGVIYEYDEQREVFLPRATEHLEVEIVETMLATPVRKGEGATGRLAEVQEPIQLPDILAAPAESRVRGALVGTGYRALLAVPLVREGHLLGGLAVIRKAKGEFSPEVIDLMRTFATQSALAIQNARLFRELKDKGRQLEAASRHKSEFLANMSHELRTPLNAIIGFSEVLTERMFGELNEKQDEYLKDIHASGQHLLSLINDILDLSKIEAGRMELELKDFDLPQAISNAVTLVRERAGRRGIALHQALDQRLGQIRGDERKIKQVLLNLLANALKFTPEGGRVDVRASLADGVAEISVADTGVGIAPEDQEAVFEEFRQVGTADKKVEGTGLGLTLSRKFIELHGGRIWVKSRVGLGSTFTFTVPVRNGE